MLQIYRNEAKYDLLSLLRTPGFYLPALLFPAVFYYFFGVLFPYSGGDPARVMVAYCCFGVIGPALFNFAIAVAGDRQHGWLALKRLSPMPMSAYMVAKWSSSLFFAVLILLTLYVIGGSFSDVVLSRGQWLALTLVLLLGTLPFALLGLVIGLFCSDKAAPAVVNLIYLPMAFLAGLWVPLSVLPDYVQTIAYGLPTYHFSQLAMKIIGQDQGLSIGVHIAYLAVLSAGLAWLAHYRFRRMA